MTMRVVSRDSQETSCGERERMNRQKRIMDTMLDKARSRPRLAPTLDPAREFSKRLRRVDVYLPSATSKTRHHRCRV